MSTVSSSTLVLADPVIEGEVYDGPIPEAPTADAPPADAPTTDEARAETLRTIWAKATADENVAFTDLGIARVRKARAAYMAGVLGSKTGTANNKGAMRILGKLDENGVWQDAPQNSVRPYFLAGQALIEAGWDGAGTDPTQSEIDIVTPIIGRNNNSGKKRGAGTPGGAPKAPPAAPPAGESDGDESGSTGPATPPRDPENVLIADVIRTLDEARKTLNGFTRECGFDEATAMGLTQALEDMIQTIETHTV